MTPPLPRRNPADSPRRTPSGFTLIELLVVILIIGILLALLIPAVAAAVKAAKNAQVGAEISNITTALADFKNKYGEYPPSRIILHNSGDYNPTNATQLFGAGDITVGDLNQRTARAMKKFFPRAGAFFNTSGSGGTTFPWDGTTGTAAANYVVLQGHECLVFFLGGIPSATPDGNGGFTYAMTGFGKDPVNPFNPQSPNRNVPLYEFSPSRLQDINNFTSPSNGGPNGFPSYVDPVSGTTAPRPYAYFSSYGNNGYDPNDDNSGGYGNRNAGGTLFPDSLETDDSGNVLFRIFHVNFPVVPITSGATNAASSTAPNPYTTGDPTNAKAGWINPQTFQLLSAGVDGQWGLGGGYEPNSTTRLPAYASDSAAIPALRKRESDNISNFANGKLD